MSTPSGPGPTPSRRRRGRLGAAALGLCAALLAPLAGCGSSSNQLSGSLSDIYPLDFDAVQVQLVSSYLVVAYVKSATGEKTIKLTLDLTGFDVAPGAEIDLAGKAAGGGPRGTLQRITGSSVDLPIAMGGITLDAVPTVGKHLGGHFHAVFSRPAGRALSGDFSTDSVAAP
jgi:hypothetical protein